jgi:hypothetical protein
LLLAIELLPRVGKTGSRPAGSQCLPSQPTVITTSHRVLTKRRLPFESEISDPKVILAIQRRGFRRDLADPSFNRWIDKHGHVLSELQLLDETPESIVDLVAWFHPT